MTEKLDLEITNKNFKKLLSKETTVEERAEIEAYNAKALLGEDAVDKQFSCVSALSDFFDHEGFKSGAVHLKVLARYVDMRPVIAQMGNDVGNYHQKKIKEIIKNKKGMEDVSEETINNIVAHTIFFLKEELSACYLTGAIMGLFLLQNEHLLKPIVKKEKSDGEST